MDDATRVDAFTFEANKVFGDELKRSLAVLKGAGWRIVRGEGLDSCFSIEEEL